jgi:hypothetical protein
MTDKENKLDSRKTQNDDRQKTIMGSRKTQYDDRHKKKQWAVARHRMMTDKQKEQWAVARRRTMTDKKKQPCKYIKL